MRRRKVTEYIKQKKYYLSLLGCLIVTTVAVAIIYTKGHEEQQIANLNEVIRTEELVENPINTSLTDDSEIFHEEIPTITIHNETIEDIAPVQIEDSVPEEPLDKIEEGALAEVIEETLPESTEAFSNLDMVTPDLTEEVVNSVVENDSQQVFDVNETMLTFNDDSYLTLPLTGTIIMDYSGDTPVEFKTLQQYKINTALFIASEVGTEVKAAADGMVETIINEFDRGNLIVIYHGNGYKTVYAQLKENIDLKEGDYVKAGDVIGYVEKPTLYYTKEGSHLYFQVLKDDVAVNPNDFLQ